MARLFVEHRGRLQQYLRRRLSNDADAQELVQEAYLRLLRVKRADLIHHPEAYLFRIARNLVHELYTGRPAVGDTAEGELQELEELESRAPSPESITDDRRQLERVERVLEGVSAKCRAVLLLYWREGMTQQEIAGRLGLSRSMVQKYMASGLAYCQKRLRGSEDAGADRKRR